MVLASVIRYNKTNSSCSLGDNALIFRFWVFGAPQGHASYEIVPSLPLGHYLHNISPYQGIVPSGTCTNYTAHPHDMVHVPAKF